MTILQYGVEDLEDLMVGDALTIFTSSPLGRNYMHAYEGELLAINESHLVMICFNKTETELVEIKIPIHKVKQIDKRINITETQGEQQ